MNPSGQGKPGQQGNPSSPVQSNTVGSGNLYATQGGNIHINTPGKTGLRIDSKVLLITLVADVILFFYGMLSYTGNNTTGDDWRAGIFLFMFLATCAMIGRWIRRRV